MTRLNLAHILTLVALTLPACGPDKGDGTDGTDGTTDSDASSVDVDADGYTAAEDCNDNDGTVHPGATEVCDGIDNNCDDTVD